MKKERVTLLFFILLLCSFRSNAQIDSTSALKIDSLFTKWNIPNHPGGAVAVMSANKIIFSKAYGLASLEYLVPNSTGTIFNTGSVSKQFTAMGIVRLEEQGKLSFDDDIRKYVVELPDFGETITIRHLLHHTSGLRSLHALFRLAGWRNDDSRTNKDLNRFILKQKELNFKPGSEFLYCNTGYMLMVNIIEQVTGEPFKDWMKKNIFDELDMPQTYVEDKYSRVVANNATSYYGRDKFERAVEYWGYVGSGNMHSTTGDLLTWLSNFNTPKIGWESSFKKMLTVDALNDGKVNNYAFGVIVDEHLGSKRIQHGGAIGGFRAFVASYPDDNLNIVVLTNFSAGNPGGKSDQIADIILGGKAFVQSQPEEIKSIDLSNEDLKKFEGSFWNNRQKYSRKIYLRNDTLRYSRSAVNESPLVPIKENEFKMLNASNILKVEFEGDKMIVSSNSLSPAIFDKVKDKELKEQELSEYAGKFYSVEVESTYTISVDKGQMSIYHPRHGAFPLKVLYPDILSGWPIGIIQIKRNSNNRVLGILISNGRVRNAWFEKQSGNKSRK